MEYLGNDTFWHGWTPKPCTKTINVALFGISQKIYTMIVHWDTTQQREGKNYHYMEKHGGISYT